MASLMISTADKILAQWQGWKIKGGQYRGSCPGNRIEVQSTKVIIENQDDWYQYQLIIQTNL
jgi:hypothetical protein